MWTVEGGPWRGRSRPTTAGKQTLRTGAASKCLPALQAAVAALHRLIAVTNSVFVCGAGISAQQKPFQNLSTNLRPPNNWRASTKNMYPKVNYLKVALHFIIRQPIHLHELPDLLRCSNCGGAEHLCQGRRMTVNMHMKQLDPI